LEWASIPQPERIATTPSVPVRAEVSKPSDHP
jgi:hypothetical protein